MLRCFCNVRLLIANLTFARAAVIFKISNFCLVTFLFLLYFTGKPICNLQYETIEFGVRCNKWFSFLFVCFLYYWCYEFYLSYVLCMISMCVSFPFIVLSRNVYFLPWNFCFIKILAAHLAVSVFGTVCKRFYYL